MIYEQFSHTAIIIVIGCSNSKYGYSNSSNIGGCKIDLEIILQIVQFCSEDLLIPNCVVNETMDHLHFAITKQKIFLKR